MKELNLHLTKNSGGGILSLGLDIVWDNNDFKFDGFEKSAMFETVAAAQADGENRVIIAAANLNAPVQMDGAFIFLQFEFDGPEDDVHFNIENLSAKDGQGRDVDIILNIVDIEVGRRWTLDFVWI